MQGEQLVAEEAVLVVEVGEEEEEEVLADQFSKLTASQQVKA